MKSQSTFRLLPVSLIAALAAGVLVLPAHAQQIVRKTAEPFESATWKAGEDSSAGGKVTLSTDVAGELGAVSKSSANLEASFSGTGFEFFGASPVNSLVIPGVTRKISLWVRGESDYGWTMQFKDGWGRGEANGHKFEWSLAKSTGPTWKQATFTIPQEWVQPLTINGITVHNWGKQAVKGTAQLSIDQLQVETDIADVDPETGILKTWRPAGSPAEPEAGSKMPAKAPVTPLLTSALNATKIHNVFSGVAPEFTLSAQNWRPEPATGTLQWKVTDHTGATIKSGNSPLTVDENLSLPLALGTPKYGVYQLDSTIAWNTGKSSSTSQSYAVIPVPKPLSEADKDNSPYGLCVLGARAMMADTFRQAGIIWFRDYGFDYEWMLRAKGADKSYGGWPWYPKIVKRYEAAGVRVLADIKAGIKPPVGGKIGPSAEWTREMVGILTAFPSITTFELDNEYDLNGNNVKLEQAVDWANYRAYHKKFGQLVQILGDGKWTAVENGRAGVWPDRLRKVVESGDFAPIDVVNSHHYTGTDPPETNVFNHNTGFLGDETVLLFFDQLRAAKRAGAADGKQREHWLTEFGWDTKAGPIVSPIEEAAYLPRAYMMLLAAGTEKGFWFFDLDGPQAIQFFDGCGLFTHDQQPKLDYASFAGLTNVLPRPKYKGMINTGPGTWGYLFENDGKLVASLWTLDKSVKPQTVDFGGAALYDYLGNPLPAGKVQLGIEPVYAVGVTPGANWTKQANYSLDSPYLVSVTAGDSVTADLKIANDRTAAIAGKVKLQLPAGWEDVSGEKDVTVPAGKTVNLPLTFKIAGNEPLGEKMVRLAVSEGEPLHTIPLRVQIRQPLTMKVRGLQGQPGESDVSIRLTNRSAQPLDGTLTFTLPATWKTASPTQKIGTLKPMEVRDMTYKVNWSPNWKPGEMASVEYKTADGRSAKQPLIPSQLTVAKASALTMDGNLKDWPAAAKLPDWVLGSTEGTANASAYVAWAPQGLYIGLDVHDSKVSTPDPKSFWVGDVLELFVDTRNKKVTRKYEAGDHQFWLVPQLDKKRVYLGQWKRNTEIPATIYDVPGLQSSTTKTADGYVLECLIPASVIQGYKPEAGANLGLNLNLSVKGATSDREVFWTIPKGEAAEQPARWGTVVLGP